MSSWGFSVFYFFILDVLSILPAFFNQSLNRVKLQRFPRILSFTPFLYDWCIPIFHPLCFLIFGFLPNNYRCLLRFLMSRTHYIYLSRYPDCLLLICFRYGYLRSCYSSWSSTLKSMLFRRLLLFRRYYGWCDFCLDFSKYFNICSFLCNRYLRYGHSVRLSNLRFFFLNFRFTSLFSCKIWLSSIFRLINHLIWDSLHRILFNDWSRPSSHRSLILNWFLILYCFICNLGFHLRHRLSASHLSLIRRGFTLSFFTLILFILFCLIHFKLSLLFTFL